MVFTHKIVCRKSPKLYASYHNQTPQKTCFNLTEKAAFNLPNNTATSAEPVRPFLSGKLLQLVLQCLFIIDGFPQFLFAFLQFPVEFFQL